MSKPYIKATMETDLNAYHAFACCCHLTSENLNELGVSIRRIQGHVNDEYWKVKHVWDNSSKSIKEFFTPTKDGAKFMGEKIYIKSNDFYNSQSPTHDMALYKAYMECEHKEHWITENEWRERMGYEIERLRSIDNDRATELEDRLRNHSISCPDGGYMKDGQVYAIEILTSNYSTDQVEAKNDFCEVIGAEQEFYRI